MKATIFDYGMNGEGVCKVDGKIFLIPYSLVGENVEFEVSKDYGNYAQGCVLNVDNSNVNRTNPPCPYFCKCGGCDLQHMNYSEQLKFKTCLLKKTIKKLTNIEVDVQNCVASSLQYNYRNKCSFNFSKGIGGFYQSATNDIVKIDSCLLAKSNINKVLNTFKPYATASVKHLVVREIDEQILVGVVTSEKLDLLDFFDELKKNFKKIGLYQVLNARKDNVVLSGKVYHVGGLKEIKVENFGVKYSVDLLGFHQTNIDIQNKIYEYVLSKVNAHSVIVNGFSGQGLLSAILSTKAKKVYGIEINASSHKSAENLKRNNQISNLVNIKGDFNKEISKIKDIDILVLDPAKKGCGKEVLKTIDEPNKIMYISCNPIALSKDLIILMEKYEIESVQPFDMFPNTKSVETVVVLNKKKQ